MSPRHLVLALLIVLVWGVNFVAVRWAVDEVPPLLLTATRYIVAVLPVIFFIRPPQVRLPVLMAYGFAIGAMQFGFLFLAIRLGMPAGLSSLVVQLQAFFTAGLAIVLLGERPTRWQIVGAAIAFGGIGVIALERPEGALLLPLLLTIAAAISWSMGNIASKLAGRVDMLGLVIWSSLVPPVPLLLASLVFEGPGAIPLALDSLTWRGIASIAFMSYAATVFGYSAWSLLLSRYPASLVAPFSLLVPIVGIGAAYLLLGETITAYEIAGSILVFAGLLLNVFGPRLLRGRAVAAAPK